MISRLNPLPHSPTPWGGLYSATKTATHMIMDTLWMECKPLGIHVTTVAPGFIKSNISDNARAFFHITEDTLYPSYIPQILRRLDMAKSSNAMPTDVFAEKVVNETIKANPPRYMTLASGSLLFQVLSWLPRILVLTLFWRRFSKP